MKNKTFSSVVLALLLIVTLGLASCGGDDAGSEHDNADGDTADGDAAPMDGDSLADGDDPDGDDPDGDENVPDGDVAYADGDSEWAGEAATDGDMPMDGDMMDGDSVDGDNVDGDSADGDSDNFEDGDAPEEEIDPLALCPEEEEPVVMYLSSDDSNSVASPVIARSQINQGTYPTDIRIWEFLNYYRVPYDAPEGDNKVAVYADMHPNEEDGVYTLQVAARSFDMETRVGRPMNLTFILDTSGSMNGKPINLLREVCRTVAGQLREGDIVSLVTWNTSQTTDLMGYAVSGPNDETLLDRINSISASGGTNLSAGLNNGYELAQTHFDSSRLNRVLLVSDGQANVGTTDENIIAAAADDSEGEGIYMVGVGVGDGYNDKMMDTVTDAGRGAYIFIDSVDEAQKMFGSRFLENMEIAVRALRMEVTLPWYFSMKEFHGEEWSHNPQEVEPQHLAPNDVMVFHQVIQACWHELVSGEDEIIVRANFADPITRQHEDVEQTFTMADLMDRGSASLTKGDAIVAYAELLQYVYDMRRSEGRETAKYLVGQMKDQFRELFDASYDGDYSEIADTLEKLENLL